MKRKQGAGPTAKQARMEAARRGRRVIFNDDTEELSYEEAHTREGFLTPRLEPLIGTHADTISWSVLGTAGDAPAYASRDQPIYGDAHGGPPPNRPTVMHYGFISNPPTLPVVLERGAARPRRFPLEIVDE